MGSFRKRSSAPENQVTMGIGRDSLHKRRSTGGRQKKWRKKRKHELGRIPAGTKISSNTCVRRLRVRGGNYKFRALRLDAGNWSWASEAVSRKTRVLDVTYNASNNELVRTQTLVKSAIVQIDATPFRHWYESHYGVKIGVKKIKGQKTEEVVDDTKRSGSLTRKLAARTGSSTLCWTSSSSPVGSTPASPPGQDSAEGATGTSLRVRSSSST